MSRKKQRSNQKQSIFRPRKYFKRLASRTTHPEIKEKAKLLYKGLFFINKYRDSEDSNIQKMWIIGHNRLLEIQQELVDENEYHKENYENRITDREIVEIEEIIISGDSTEEF